MDRLRIIVMLTLLSILLFSTYGVEASDRILTKNITETQYDDMYECIDFYKQPAFDHPLLANHTFHHEMRPTSMPGMFTSNIRLSMNDTEIQLKGKSCPIGSVPIRRITEEGRIRKKLHLERYGPKHDALTVKNSGTHYAIVRTKSNPPKKYNGGGAGISIWNPHVQNFEYSSGQLVIRNGQDNIQVGWTVNRDLNDDYHTHLFIYTSVGATRCYNTYCPAFVIVDKEFIVDEIIDTYSRQGGPTYFMRFMIYKDSSDGHWWLTVGSSYKPVGFWPKSIFNGDTATSVEWGGQVYSPFNVPSPPMGSGHFLKKSTLYDAYCKFVRVVNENYNIVDAMNIETYVDSSRYQVNVQGNVGGDFGNLFYWGGPGGKQV